MPHTHPWLGKLNDPIQVPPNQQEHVDEEHSEQGPECSGLCWCIMASEWHIDRLQMPGHSEQVVNDESHQQLEQ